MIVPYPFFPTEWIKSSSRTVVNKVEPPCDSIGWRLRNTSDADASGFGFDPLSRLSRNLGDPRERTPESALRAVEKARQAVAISDKSVSSGGRSGHPASCGPLFTKRSGEPLSRTDES